MNMVKFLLFLGLLFTCSRSAFACSCFDPSVREKFRSSDLVFLGKVLSWEAIAQSDKRWSEELYLYTVTLEVEKKWKGPKGKTLKVNWSYDMPGMCNDLPLIKDERYLIYTTQDKYGFGVYPDCGTNYRAKFHEEEINKLNRFWFRTSARLFPFPKL